jgi:hypothetical protein
MALIVYVHLSAQGTHMIIPKHTLPDGGFIHRRPVLIDLRNAGGDKVQAQLRVVGFGERQCSPRTTPSSRHLPVLSPPQDQELALRREAPMT